MNNVVFDTPPKIGNSDEDYSNNNLQVYTKYYIQNITTLD
jgi:hypothetical protein